jgi:hypothetical protein
MTSFNKATLKTILLTLILTITTPHLHALTGQGTQENPYKIQSLTDFNDFANNPNYWLNNVYTRLETDINLATQSYTTAVIAPDFGNSPDNFVGTPFFGSFDGNDHTICNLTIDTEGAVNYHLGLFGKIDGRNAMVKNLGLENVNVTSADGSELLSGLCGYNSRGTISNCYTTGLVVGGYDSKLIGGLCGYTYDATIINCYAACSVISGEDSDGIGGLCGFVYEGTIINCYATGPVIIGDNSNDTGGLCGYLEDVTVTDCFFYLLGGPDNNHGTPLDDIQIINAESYVGFDFVGDSNDGIDDYWTIADGHLPKLSWQTDDGPLPPVSSIVTTLSGTGYSDEPFQINTHADFTEFRTNNRLRCGYYILNTDVNLADEIFTTAVINSDFGGYFDGNGYAINNVNIETVNFCPRVGLFKNIVARVTNLGMENFSIAGNDHRVYSGGLCGFNYGSIVNCYANGSIMGGDNALHLGGLCGINYNNISDCNTIALITGGNNSISLGGLCGENRRGLITNCNSAGLVTGGENSKHLGGLCGENRGTITDCNATCSVYGEKNSECLGGVCGYLAQDQAIINQCYAEGTVTGGIGSSGLGGVCGFNQYGTINNSHASGTVSSGHDSYDLGGLCGKNDGDINNSHAEGQIIGGDNSDFLGGLCGSNYSPITKSYATGTVTGSSSSCYLGGLCGGNYSTITKSYATGSITGATYLGGLCGISENASINNCYASGSVSGVRSLGGLCGYSTQSPINNSYATGSVSGYGTLGGLCGWNSNSPITNCYAIGLIVDVDGSDGSDGTDDTGGLCGLNWGTITNCYFYILGGPDNNCGTPLDDLQMLDAASYAGFDFADDSNDGFDDFWSIVSGRCPILTWQTDDGASLVPDPMATTLSGSGYWYDPFQINTYADFIEFRDNNSLDRGCYILTTDINLDGETFTKAVINRPFGGHFDGNGHIIRNITIETTGTENYYLGLFSMIYASVKNLGVENISIACGVESRYVGGVCGWNAGGTITECYATNSITGGSRTSSLGGLCGYNHRGKITKCYAIGSIAGGDSSNQFGGLCGHNYEGIINNSYSACSVTGNDSSKQLGGLCGYNSTGNITHCYATGSIAGGPNSRSLGGLCGFNHTGTIAECYAASSITSTNDSEYLGGLCGGVVLGAVTNCFWDVETTGMTEGYHQDSIYNPSTITNVVGKTTDEMQTMETYTDAGWDFDWYDDGDAADWFIQINEYPILTWQISPADLYTDGSNNAKDFAVFAQFWQRDDCSIYNDYCDYADLDFSGNVDIFDLIELANHWLAAGIYN